MTALSVAPDVPSRPIIFGAESVRAILAGTKTQSRRVAKELRDRAGEWPGHVTTLAPGRVIGWSPGTDPAECDALANRAYLPEDGIACPYGVPGDRLWVREQFCAHWDAHGLRSEVAKTAGRIVTDGSAVKQHDGTYSVTSEAKPLFIHYAADIDAPPFQHLRWKSPIFMYRCASRIELEITDVRCELLQEITEADAVAEGATPLMGIERWSAYDPKHDGYIESGRPWTVEEVYERGLENVRHHPARAIGTAQQAFASAWNSINGRRAPWASDPWCWVVSFRVLSPALEP